MHAQHPPAASPEQFAVYVAEILETLRKIASANRQILLSHLLALAAMEARMLAKLPPGPPQRP